MALTQENVDQAKAIKAKVEELRADVMNSMSLRAVGGAHIANELGTLTGRVEKLIAVIEADVEAGAEA